MPVYDFDDCLAFSKSFARSTTEETIAGILPGCVTVEESGVEDDKRGIDYVATLRRGATVNIDLKCREPGCAKYWQEGPELALEDWSVVPDHRYSGTVGWTLDESKLTDYTLHMFDPNDTRDVFLLPFQLLRAAFRHYAPEWRLVYKTAKQDSGYWQSSCIFVPAHAVVRAIEEQMVHHRMAEARTSAAPYGRRGNG